MSVFHNLCKLCQPTKKDAPFTVVGEVGSRWYFLFAKKAGERSSNPGMAYWALCFVDLDITKVDQPPDDADKACRKDYGIPFVVLQAVEMEGFQQICAMFRPKNPDANYSLAGNTARRRYFTFPRFTKAKGKDTVQRYWDLCYMEAPQDSDPFEVPIGEPPPDAAQSEEMPF